jgi:hypothetical protein
VSISECQVKAHTKVWLMLDNQLSNFLINFLWTKDVLLKKALYNQMSVIVGLQKKLWLHNWPSWFGKYEETNLRFILNLWLDAIEWHIFKYSQTWVHRPS